MERNYLAFISYRHVRPDTNVSGYLRKMLEGWHLPKSCALPKKRRVFRDTDELPTSTDLGADIENALKHSDCLIAVCSEEYVTSKWCMREIDRYIEMGRKDRIFPILISGTEATSIPAQLKGIEPVMDLRGADGPLRRKVYDRIPYLLELLSGTGERNWRFRNEGSAP